LPYLLAPKVSLLAVALAPRTSSKCLWNRRKFATKWYIEFSI